MFYRFFPACLAVLLLLLMTACDSSDPADGSPTPVSPTPTPSPPPSCFTDWFRVTSMVVGDSSQGVDLDGDGTVDNNIEAALEAVNQALYLKIEASVCGSEPCTPSQQILLGVVQEILDSVFSVGGLSSALNNPIQQGTVNYLMKFTNCSSQSRASGNPPGQLERPSATLSLQLCSGTLEESGWTAANCSPWLDSTPDPVGAYTFGPTTMILSITVADSSGDVLFSYSFEIDDVMVYLPAYNDTKIGVYVGGAIPEQELMTLVNLVVGVVNQTIVKAGGQPVDQAGIDMAVETTLEPELDIDLDGDGTMDAVSIGLIVSLETADIVE